MLHSWVGLLRPTPARPPEGWLGAAQEKRVLAQYRVHQAGRGGLEGLLLAIRDRASPR